MNVDYMNFESEGHVVLSTNAVLCPKPSTMYSKKRGVIIQCLFIT
jgi:hypothetical protein